MKLILFLFFNVNFCLITNSQVVKMKAKEFAFIQNMADSFSIPTFVQTDRLIFIDYNLNKITAFGDFDDVYYIVDYTKVKTTNTGTKYLFNCVGDDGKKRVITMSVWTDNNHPHQIYMRIKNPDSYFIYNLDFLK